MANITEIILLKHSNLRLNNSVMRVQLRVGYEKERGDVDGTT